MNQIYLQSTDNGDLYPLHVGHYPCPPGNSYGPFVRDYYILHFILGGKGVLINKDGTHPVSTGEMFFIREGEIATYVADRDDPWEYVWIAFSGKRANSYAWLPDVMDIPADIDEKLYRWVNDGVRSPDIYTSILYEMTYHLSDFDKTVEEDNTVQVVHRYIKYNYQENITISGLAAMFGFERSYLYRLFNRRYGMGPKEYLTKVRMNKAKWLLSKGYSVGECALMVGYSDAFVFSKAYKKFYGVSPSQDNRN